VRKRLHSIPHLPAIIARGGIQVAPEQLDEPLRQRNPANPIIRPDASQWDSDACYKPYAIFDGKRWMLWYNGRSGHLEQVGVVIHDGVDLGFDAK
jgi:hypothetical protein